MPGCYVMHAGWALYCTWLRHGYTCILFYFNYVLYAGMVISYYFTWYTPCSQTIDIMSYCFYSSYNDELPIGQIMNICKTFIIEIYMYTIYDCIKKTRLLKFLKL